MSNAREQLTLVVEDQILQQFTYRDSWYPTTDGRGSSLEIVSATNPDLDSWALAASWRASAVAGGTPGKAGQIVGDADGDGVFDSSDLVILFQTGKYDDDEPNNATFEEGDWNLDGDFDSSDLVLAFQIGHYIPAASPLPNQFELIDRIFDGDDDRSRERHQNE